ncbi:hypothetical protein N9A67_03385 [Rhodobacteraceae bacterium]|nr:hypothetical protein [Paracoccaceae bacterium]
MKLHTQLIIATAIPVISACSTSQPTTSANTAHTYLPVGATYPTAAMVNSGNTLQELKGFAVVSPIHNLVEGEIDTAGGTIDLGADWRARPVTANVSNVLQMTSPDGFQGYEPSNCALFYCFYEYEQTATGTNGDRLYRRDEFYQQSYDYVMPFRYVDAAEEYLGSGFVGVETLPSDIPQGFSAAYEGEAKFSVFNAQGDRYFDDEKSSPAILEVNSGGVSLYIPELNEDTTQGMSYVLTPFKSYQVTNMQISGNQFEGGIATAFESGLGGTVVNPVSGATEFSTNGAFYGFDQNLDGPDEAALLVNEFGQTERLQIEILAD